MGYSWKLPVVLYFQPSCKSTVRKLSLCTTESLYNKYRKLYITSNRCNELLYAHFLSTFTRRLFFSNLAFSRVSTNFSKPMTVVSAHSVSKCFASVYKKDESPTNSGQLNSKNSDYKAPKYSRKHFTEPASYEAFQHCMKLVKARDYSNYVGALLHPTTLQPEIFALLAFNVEVAVVRDQIKRNSGVTGIYRLQFWKDTVEAIYLNPNAPLPRQPVATALASYVKLKDAKLLIDLITSRQHTLGDRPYTALSDICDYGRNTTGALLKLIMNVLLRKFYCADTARKDDECLMKCYEAAENMGAAVGIVTILRSVAPLLSRGILLLPVDLMTTYNVKVGRKSLFDGEITFLLRDMANEAKVRLLNSRKLKDVIPKELRMPLMASGTTVDFVLSVLEESKYNLLDARLQRNPELLAWRLWWKKMNKVY